MPEYRVNNRIVSDTDPNFESMLESVYKTVNRPLCMCHDPGIEMQIAKINDHFYIKRMPKKGKEHSSECGSFETPPELSGLGDLMGTAIQEEDGVTVLKFDFPLSHKAEKPAAEPSNNESESVKASSKRLSLRAMLHFIWKEAGLNRWHPTIVRRSWMDVYQQLTVAADNKKTNEAFVKDFLFLPEPFVVDRKAEIIARRMNLLTSYHSKHPKKLMLMIGEVEEGGFSGSGFGGTLIVKHIPDFHFLMNKQLYDNIESRFAIELALFRSSNGNRLLIAATFSLSNQGVATIEQITMMAATHEWIPFETMYERNLIMQFLDKKRSFEKVLRYNFARDFVMADFILLDTKPQTTEMYLIPETKRKLEYKVGVEAAIKQAQTVAAINNSEAAVMWVWDPAEDEQMPAIPDSVMGQTVFPKYGIRAVM